MFSRVPTNRVQSATDSRRDRTQRRRRTKQPESAGSSWSSFASGSRELGLASRLSRQTLPARRLLLMVTLFVAGCSDLDQTEHLEHVTPDHKPASFAACVEQLELRGQRFFAGELDESATAELRDIAGWVSELATDSDLRRAQWEQTRAIGEELETLLSGPVSETSRSRWEQLVRQLSELVPFAADDHANGNAHRQHGDAS